LGQQGTSLSALNLSAASPGAGVPVRTPSTPTYSGAEAHLAVDEESGPVRQAEMTPANAHDSRLGEALIQGDEQGFFADRAIAIGL
jgi:IS5 family transposase